MLQYTLCQCPLRRRHYTFLLPVLAAPVAVTAVAATAAIVAATVAAAAPQDQMQPPMQFGYLPIAL
jgi:hypothetical protein